MTVLYWLIFGGIFGIVMIGVGIALAVLEKSRKTGAMQRLGRAAVDERRQAPATPVLFDLEGPAGKKSGWDRLPGMKRLQDQISSAGLEWKPQMLVGGMAGLSVLGGLVGIGWHVLIYPLVSALALAVVLGSLPYLYVRRTRRKRLAAFESQFPDTLDFFARAVRAGHAFSVSLELLASESPEPTRTELRRVFAEHNLGAPIELALRGLIERIPLVDVRFFVSAILLQRETGGNLSEILQNLGEVIRQRFRLKGHVRAASAHGRMTAGALTVIPIAVLIMLSITSPKYLKIMTGDRMGRFMILGAVAGQFIGYVFMKKIVNIKV